MTEEQFYADKQLVINRLLTSHYKYRDTVEKWLRGSNAFLMGARPIDLIRMGRVAEVLIAIDQMDGGGYL